MIIKRNAKKGQQIN